MAQMELIAASLLMTALLLSGHLAMLLRNPLMQD
jgi:hypothetical protein